MAFQEESKSLEIYQFRFWLKGVSPMIWRRLLIRSDSSIADLHYSIQIAMSWCDSHLHQFMIRGKSYGLAYVGGISFSDNAREIYLKDFDFRPKERFIYQYNFNDNWEYEVRFEKQLELKPQKLYPICIGGNRQAPPEECGGPLNFMELQDHYCIWQIEEELLELTKDYQSGEKDTDEFRDGIQELAYWANQSRFNRRTINRQLQNYFKDDEQHRKSIMEVIDED